jgi:hypothetical protein
MSQDVVSSLEDNCETIFETWTRSNSSKTRNGPLTFLHLVKSEKFTYGNVLDLFDKEGMPDDLNVSRFGRRSKARQTRENMALLSPTCLAMLLAVRRHALKGLI